MSQSCLWLLSVRNMQRLHHTRGKFYEPASEADLRPPTWAGVSRHGSPQMQDGTFAESSPPRSYSVLLRTASFTSPAASWAEPLALSSFPSRCISLSPVTLPAVSFIAPLAFGDSFDVFAVHAGFSCQFQVADNPA